MKDVTTVQMKRNTRDRLDKYGTRHDSYDQIVNNVINELEELRRQTKEHKDKSKK